MFNYNSIHLIINCFKTTRDNYIISLFISGSYSVSRRIEYVALIQIGHTQATIMLVLIILPVFGLILNNPTNTPISEANAALKIVKRLILIVIAIVLAIISVNAVTFSSQQCYIVFEQTIRYF